MANYLVTDTELTSIADAIRTKGGTSASLEFPTDFVSAIENIPSGGGVEISNVSILYSGADYCYYTDANMEAQTYPMYGSADLSSIPMPVGSIVTLVRTGMLGPMPYPAEYTNLESIATYTIGSKGQARIFSVTSSS